MNYHTITAFVFAIALFQQADAELEAVWGGKFLDEDYVNEELGISLTVVEKPAHQDGGIKWGSGRQDVTEKNGEKFITWIRESDKRSSRCIVPIKEDVIWKLIRESDEPPEFRFLAITNLHLLDVSDTTKAKMLEEASRIEDAWVRGHAWSRVFWFPERELVAHLFPNAVKDPCLDIAHDALPEICKHYNLLNPDGSEIKITRMWRGLVSARYRLFHQERELVAGRLREHDNQLISNEDLETIRRARIPPDDWFRVTLRRERPEDVN